MTRAGLAALLASVLGVAAWEMIVPAGSRKEAWDLPAYWQFAYPAMIAGSFVLGWLAPERPWRWGLLVGLGQGVWSLAKLTIQSGMPSLWPLGLVAFALISLPCVAVAWLGSRLARFKRS